jgi:DNA-binding XRE family transcriptional regulator
MTKVRQLSTLPAFLGTSFKETTVVVMDRRPWEKAEIAERYKRLRREARLMQRELGDLIGVDRKTVNRIENLRSMPDPRTWKRFAELEATKDEPQLGTSMDWLAKLREELAATLP